MSSNQSIVVDHAELFHSKGIYIPTRTIWLGPIDPDDEDTNADTLEKLEMNLEILANIIKKSPNGKQYVTIKMRNEGGYVTDGMAIYDAIKAYEYHIDIVVSGEASSMGSVILQAADKRFIRPNSCIMIHDGGRGGEGHKKTLKNWNDYYDEIDERVYNIYLEKIREKKPTFTKKTLKDWMIHDKVFTAQQALEYGLVDEILE